MFQQIQQIEQIQQYHVLFPERQYYYLVGLVVELPDHNICEFYRENFYNVNLCCV